MGIDYGLGQTNIDTETGFRYGVVSCHELDSWVYEELEPIYSECDNCEGDNEDCDCQSDFREPDYHEVNNENWTATASFESDSDLFVTKSKWVIRCGFCSPCAPGAGYILSDGDDCWAYCPPPDFFTDEKIRERVKLVSEIQGD
jgi:hypothetical protein